MSPLKTPFLKAKGLNHQTEIPDQDKKKAFSKETKAKKRTNP